MRKKASKILLERKLLGITRHFFCEKDISKNRINSQIPEPKTPETCGLWNHVREPIQDYPCPLGPGVSDPNNICPTGLQKVKG